MKIDASKDDTCFSNPPPAVDKGSDKDDNGQDTDPVDKQPPARKDDKKGKLREALRKDDNRPVKMPLRPATVQSKTSEPLIMSNVKMPARPLIPTRRQTIKTL